MRPQRIVLSRRAGFDLQAVSLAMNGLPGQSVARPGKWGNPFSISAIMAETGLDRNGAQAEAVDRHRRWMDGDIEADRPRPSRADIRVALAGRNLACWCPMGTPCHAENLIAIANE